jgi:DNA-binding response OmpR family regulator
MASRVPKIRELGSKCTPIVFMSSIAKESYYGKGFAAGGDYYLTKSLSETIFFAALKKNHKSSHNAL